MDALVAEGFLFGECSLKDWRSYKDLVWLDVRYESWCIKYKITIISFRGLSLVECGLKYWIFFFKSYLDKWQVWDVDRIDMPDVK